MRSVLYRALADDLRWLVIAVLLGLASSALTLLYPWFAGQLAQQVLDSGSLTGEIPARTAIAGLLASSPLAGVHSLTGFFALWACAIALQGVARFFGVYLSTRSGARVLARLSQRIQHQLLNLPLRWHSTREHGDLLSLHSNDAAVLVHFYTGVLGSLLPSVAVLVGAIVLMAQIDSAVTALVLLLAPVFFVVVKLFGRSLRPLSTRVAESRAQVLTVASEQLRTIRLITLFRRTAAAEQQHTKATGQLLELRTQQFKRQAALEPALYCLSSLSVLLVLGLSAGRLSQGALSNAELVSLLLYGFLLTRPISSFANLFGEATQARGARERLGKLFALQPTEHQGSQPFKNPHGDIAITDLSFAYPDRDPLFAGLTHTFTGGATIAISGANGAGKSTLLQLVKAAQEGQGGSINIGGQSIQQIDAAQYDRHVVLVEQTTELINASVADNIRYARPDATHAEVEQAAHTAQADEFIKRLHNGYKTMIGPEGVALSGGERQRLALARALLVDPAILLLDEPTTFFDGASEVRFLEQVRATWADKTVIMATHSRQCLEHADQVLVLRHGKLTVTTNLESYLSRQA